MTQHALLDASCRVALAALLHDLGKFAERAGLDDVSQDQVDNHKSIYCPKWNSRYSHVHAAYTALAFDDIERHLPDTVKGDAYPFASRQNRETQAADDSLVNAAARHHTPDTFLQWVIATADRLASGFERSDFEDYNAAEEENRSGANYRQARQWPLLESIRLGEKASTERVPAHRYPLKPLAPKSIFPVEAKDCEHSGRGENETARDEYRELWQQFTGWLKGDAGRERIPRSHKANLALWLDHFDSLWLTFTHAIPSATAGKKDGKFIEIPADVSLYDHSKTVAALTVALWRWHEEHGDTGEAGKQRLRLLWDGERQAEAAQEWAAPKFLLIQGDFFGIQDFIFASGGATRKKAAKLLRGRSFYVSLLAECAALKILDTLGLPPTSQIVNAAGKFLIVAPNTGAVKAELSEIQRELDDWFLKHAFGQSGIGLAWTEAAAKDFLRCQSGDHVDHVGRLKRSGADSPFRTLMAKVFAELERKKLQRFNLCAEAHPPAIFGDFLDRFDNDLGVCAIDGRSPAVKEIDGIALSALAIDQIAVGDYLVKQQRVLLTQDTPGHNTLELPLFGYHVSFTQDEEETGKFGSLAKTGNLRRAWDFSRPDDDGDAPLFNGYARRHIDGYVPRFDETDLADARLGKYDKLDRDDREQEKIGNLKTLNHLACENRRKDENGKWIGQTALITLKGDVDNLGQIFEKGLAAPTFAGMAGLSRQINAFFAIYLPWACATQCRNTYTVFAGGDDFFLIGPWHSTLELAARINADFARYVVNKEIHFSAGLSMTKPGLPIRHLAESAEAALAAAKAFVGGEGKNAVTCYGQTVDWKKLDTLLAASERLGELEEHYQLSTGYLYGLLRLCEMAENSKRRPEDAIWRAWLHYRTRRFVVDKLKKLDETEKRSAQEKLVGDIGDKGILKHGETYKIALFTHLYQKRD